MGISAAATPEQHRKRNNSKSQHEVPTGARTLRATLTAARRGLIGTAWKRTVVPVLLQESFAAADSYATVDSAITAVPPFLRFVLRMASASGGKSVATTPASDPTTANPP